MKLYRDATIAKFERTIAGLEKDLADAAFYRDLIHQQLEKAREENERQRKDIDSLQQRCASQIEVIAELHGILCGDGEDEIQAPMPMRVM